MREDWVGMGGWSGLHIFLFPLACVFSYIEELEYKASITLILRFSFFLLLTIAHPISLLSPSLPPTPR